MASGIIEFGRSSSAGRYLQGKIEWSSVADNAIHNDSDVTARIYVKKGHHDYTLNEATYGTWTYGITINGSAVSGAESASVLESYVLIGETTVKNIAHNGDGTKSVVISGYVSGPSGTSFSGETTAGSATVVLDTIPRATTIAAGKADIGSALQISTNRKNKSFTHTLEYAFGSLRGYIDGEGHPSATPVKLTNESPWFYLPDSFYSQIPGSPEGAGTLYCRTYSGNTQIGDTQTAHFSAVASKALCSPALTWNVTDINEKTVALTGSKYILVKGHSVARCAVTGQPKNGAYITAATVNGKKLEINEGGYGYMETVAQSGDFTFYVQDSRGYDCTVYGSRVFVNYIDLTCNVTAARTDPTSGKATLIVEGKYFGDSFPTGDNTLELKYSIDGGEEIPVVLTPGQKDYAVTVQLEGLDYQKSYRIEVTVEDRLMCLKRTVTVSEGIPVFDWGKNDFSFHVPVYMDGVALDYVVEQGSQGIWHYRKWNSGYVELEGKKGVYQFDTLNVSGNIFYGDCGGYTYPFALTEVYTASFGFLSTTGNVFYWGQGVSTTGIVSSFCGRGSNSPVAGYPGVRITGRWK